MNIIEAIKDENLFRPFLGSDLTSWRQWMIALRVLYGIPCRTSFARKLIKQCTGRDPDKLPKAGFDTALFLVGRRSGKSRMASIIAGFESVLAGHESKLSPGERGVVPILSPTKYQSRVVRDYVRKLFTTPLLQREVVAETKEGFELASGSRIEIQAGDWRTIRSYTLLCAVTDETAFFGVDSESAPKVKSDSELIRALKPGLATVGGKLISISSPYWRRGYCFQQHKRHFGNDKSNVLVWNSASRVMNSTLARKRREICHCRRLSGSQKRVPRGIPRRRRLTCAT